MGDSLEVLNKVNGFYQAAWNNLLWFTGALFAICAIFMPLVIQYLQSRTFSRDKKAHLEYLSAEVGKAKDALKAEFDADMKVREAQVADQIQKIKSELIAKIRSEAAFAEAGIFLLQANTSSADGEHAEAARDYAISACTLLDAGNLDKSNPRRAISPIGDSLKKTSKADLEANPDVEPAINGLIATLERPEQRGFFRDDVILIKKELREALHRAPPTVPAMGTKPATTL